MNFFDGGGRSLFGVMSIADHVHLGRALYLAFDALLVGNHSVEVENAQPQGFAAAQLRDAFVAAKDFQHGPDLVRDREVACGFPGDCC